ncbi:glutamine--tRNA ligase/YqeY domain fusion protein [Flavobacteriaceae bacterium]|nr:glutamine--tRNA ligase/YqeY domain fusion protein [Flavobacteriaceae bacterium]MDA9015988.1 glutamine--tRNA ligase/YqeY domain fusion protein [Flavobacteriaceae bacterium]MDC3354238.1 glutamine--tRNA ligase/YqeY domain fusion protein [Flavobacteriaceae bacterium]
MERSLHFIEHLIEEDLQQNYSDSDLRFRFPPEPNGYLHIGHVKAICLNFNLGERYKAPVNLRFDDTNPAKEEQQFVDAIKENIRWLGYQWDTECYASDYFDQLYAWALELIDKNLAYVDSQTSEEIAEQKGTPTKAGIHSPFRDRPIEENKTLFQEMKSGKHQEGSHVLRAKIDMASPNMLLRDPVMYRILFKTHHRTGNDWCIYPMYDWTHGQSDYIEEVSHSLCSLEFKPHRDLYDWFLDSLSPLKSLRPKQREFARMNLSYTVTSKRKLAELIELNHVTGWDDPRMPTIAGLRRRGYTPTALKNFVDAAGVAKRDNVIDMSLLEHSIREDLNQSAPRVMSVLNPVKLTISNYPDDTFEVLEGEINPEQPELGNRNIPFSKHLYIEREDFKEEANRKFFRLTLGKEVRLKNAYIIKGESVVKDDSGMITEIICSYDPKSKSGSGSEESQRKVKGTLHWVSTADALRIEVRSYDRLFQEEAPDQDKSVDFKTHLNPNSLSSLTGFAEPSLLTAKPGDRFQFQRLGYFVVDGDSTKEQLVFNKTVGLRDNWSKKT